MPAPRRKTPASIPPQRRANPNPGRKPRQPSMAKDEKAAITKAARELAKKVNAELEESRKTRPSLKYATLEERKAANLRRSRQQRRARKLDPDLEPPRCKGTNAAGNPCKLAPLVPDNWDGPNVPTGLYCLHHDPNITREEAFSFKLHGSANQPLPRRITPGQVAHELMQEAPRHFLRPYLRALGLRMTEDGEIVENGTGLKLYGYSRGGQVIRSQYPDLVGQVNIAEKLWDRVFGKPRQSVDLASTNTTVAVRINMDIQRVEKVSEVLAQAGALPNGNGNGNGHVIESTATDLPETVGSETLDQ